MASSTAQDQANERCVPIRRGERRRREIAAVAERAFFQHGFTDTTMQTIAAAAGASKETLYRHFGSKEGLFSEIVENRANRFFDGVDVNLQSPGAVADVLRRLGFNIVTALMDLDALSLCRLVIAEGPRNSELGRIFYEAGPDRTRKRLATYLQAAATRGELHCPDPCLAAKIFLGAILTHYHMVGLVCPQQPPPPKAKIRAHIDEVVALFLTHYQTPRSL